MLGSRRREISISLLSYYNNWVVRIYKDIVTGRVKCDSIRINILSNNNFRIRGL